MLSTIDRPHAELFLQTRHVGRLACAAGGRPYVVPVTYVFSDGWIYGHTNDGMKLRMLRDNPQVAFEVDEIKSHRRWTSVVCSGRFEELHGTDAARALDLMIDRLTPVEASDEGGAVSWLGTFEEVEHQLRLRPTKGATYRIRVDEISGRSERPE